VLRKWPQDPGALSPFKPNSADGASRGTLNSSAEPLGNLTRWSELRSPYRIPSENFSGYLCWFASHVPIQRNGALFFRWKTGIAHSLLALL
jgi:hypothetical protein